MDNILESLDKATLLRLKRFDIARVFINLALTLFIIINVAALALFVVFLVLFLVSITGGYFNAIYLFWFCTAIIIALTNNLVILKGVMALRRDWRKKFKVFAVPCVLDKTFQDASFQPQRGMAQQAVVASGIVPRTNIFHSEDLIVGKYKGVNFAKSDVRIMAHNEQENSHVVRVFNGQWMIFDFNKPINAYVRVSERFPIGGPVMARIWGAERVKVEDVAFNKKFNVITQNPHTAFYILTPQFIEAIKFLESRISGHLVLAFSKNRLHVAVNTFYSDFEGALSLSARQNLITFHRQIQTTAKFVDLLRLDDDYFKI